MMNLITAPHLSTGRTGEALAVRFLVERGFTVLATNYLKSFGEIDIVARRTETVHFVEVKTVSYRSRSSLEGSVARETWRPEEMVHHHKLHQIAKAAQAWVNEFGYTGNVQIDVIAVRIVPRETYSTINYLENISLTG